MKALRNTIRTHNALYWTLPLIFAAQSSRVSISDCKTSTVPLAAILETVVGRGPVPNFRQLPIVIPRDILLNMAAVVINIHNFTLKSA